jgi:hypothetical protein
MPGVRRAPGVRDMDGHHDSGLTAGSHIYYYSIAGKVQVSMRKMRVSDQLCMVSKTGKVMVVEEPERRWAQWDLIIVKLKWELKTMCAAAGVH